MAAPSSITLSVVLSSATCFSKPCSLPTEAPQYLLDVSTGPATFASVIVPTRGRPEALRRAIDSVRSQDTDDWELIVADDGDGRRDRHGGVLRRSARPRRRERRAWPGGRTQHGDRPRPRRSSSAGWTTTTGGPTRAISRCFAAAPPARRLQLSRRLDRLRAGRRRGLPRAVRPRCELRVDAREQHGPDELARVSARAPPSARAPRSRARKLRRLGLDAARLRRGPRTAQARRGSASATRSTTRTSRTPSTRRSASATSSDSPPSTGSRSSSRTTCASIVSSAARNRRGSAFSRASSRLAQRQKR